MFSIGVVCLTKAMSPPPSTKHLENKTKDCKFFAVLGGILTTTYRTELEMKIRTVLFNGRCLTFWEAAVWASGRVDEKM